MCKNTENWDSICKCCGLCCLLKWTDQKTGDVFLTRVACNHLNLQTHLCDCWHEDIKQRGDCELNNGIKFDENNLSLQYAAPSSCAYVKKFITHRHTRPYPVDWSQVIHEGNISPNDLQKYIFPDSSKYFKYNPELNKLFVTAYKKLTK